MDDPVPTFSYLLSEFAAKHSKLAYISLVSPRASGDQEREPSESESNDFALKIWSPRPLLTAGGWSTSPDLAAKEADENGTITLFGRAFIANVSHTAVPP